MLRCVVLDDYQDIALASADWGALAGRVEIRVLREHVADRVALARMLADAQVVVAMRERTPFDRALLEQLPALRLLVTTGMRNASIDIVAARQRGVTVCGTRSFPGTAAELTWALILAIMRELPQGIDDMRAGRWQTGIGRSLRGATLGVVGLGNVGQRVASIARAFEMRVVAMSRSLTDGRAAELGVERAAALSDLLRESDVVTLHVTLGTETRGLIGARELATMKPTACLVNTSRGPVVDEQALVAALRGGRIAGAALDVYDREPLPDEHPFRRMRNVIATPHVGYVTRENYRVFYGDAVEDIAEWIGGKPLRVLGDGGK